MAHTAECVQLGLPAGKARRYCVPRYSVQSKELRSGCGCRASPDIRMPGIRLERKLFRHSSKLPTPSSFWTTADAARQFSSQRDCNGKNLMDTYKDYNPLLGGTSLTHNLESSQRTWVVCACAYSVGECWCWCWCWHGIGTAWQITRGNPSPKLQQTIRVCAVSASPIISR